MSAKRVIVGMSGGVDSSVAALLLLEQHYAVEGLFMKNWDEDDDSGLCTAARDLDDARGVCQQLGIHLHEASFSAEYWEQVFQHCLAEFRLARTPNPDILCNRAIKFGLFLDYAQQLGAERIATGHYARLGGSAEGTQLLCGIDEDKDQSYFLHTVDASRLSRCLFPLGELCKSEVRQLAAQASLATHNKADSVGICFIGPRRFRDFLRRYLPVTPGAIVDESGAVLGQHIGLPYYTIGQRRGLGIGGVRGGEGAWFVADKDRRRNHLVVVQGSEHRALFRKQLHATELHWVTPGVTPPVCCRARLRHRQPTQACTINHQLALAGGDSTLSVRFEQAQRAVTPGQSVVFYAGERCFGGGVITTQTAGDAPLPATSNDE